MAVYPNITGVVTLCKPEGFGYIAPDTLIGAHDKNVFFHTAVLEGADWSKVRVGQKVKITNVVSKRGVLQANGVSFI